jgi:hypothetical protein
MSAVSVPVVSARVRSPIDAYLDGLLHSWMRVLSVLGITLIPLFFVLDALMMPRALLPRFALYRLCTTFVVAGQFMVLRRSAPHRLSILHAYAFTIVTATMVALMTTDLGGFGSTYYAGLNMVIVAVNLLLPWGPVHSAVNSAIVIGLYVALNLVTQQSQPLEPGLLANNLFFLTGTAVIVVSISAVKQSLVIREHGSQRELREARDALWGELEVARQIQTVLLPKVTRVGHYEVAAIMRPATLIGGDYYDVISTAAGENWVTIGDVSGHGVEAGLVMMMAQTSLLTVIGGEAGLAPSQVLARVNRALRENLRRLKNGFYMTFTALRLDEERLLFAGLHQDLLVHRAAGQVVEVVATRGPWLGVIDDAAPFLDDTTLALGAGDVLLLHTDGVTEAEGPSGMFGQERVRQALARHAGAGLEALAAGIVAEVLAFAGEQSDDITVVALRRLST